MSYPTTGPPLERVVFFQPRTWAAEHYSNSSGEEQTWTPWFAPFLAAAARTAGVHPELVDARVHAGWRERIGALGPGDILAVSVMTGAAITDALAASTVARELGSYVVWGGPHPTLFPQQTLDQSPAHAVVPGFGYAGLLLLLNRLTGHGESTDLVDARVLTETDSAGSARLPAPAAGRGSAATVDAPDAEPDLDLVAEWEPYVNADVAIAPRTVNYVTSEGCHRRCTFCSEPTTGGGAWYVRPVERSVEVIARMVARSGCDGLKLHDPNFFHGADRAGLFADRFAQQVSLPWAASLHPADLLACDDGTLDRMARAGLCRVLMGLESPVPQLVRLAGKRYDPKQIPLMATRLARAGVRGMFTFIVGWPGADPRHYQQTIDCAFGIRDVWDAHQCKIHFLEPWPGTPIHRMVTRAGFAYPNSLREWAQVDYYHAQYAELHDPRYTAVIRQANAQLSPYVNA